MPRDMEQMQLLMALSLYINSITANPPQLIPATPEMLFGADFNNDDQNVESEYEDEDEEDVEEEPEKTENSSSSGNKSAAWTRISELNDSAESLKRISDKPLVEPA